MVMVPAEFEALRAEVAKLAAQTPNSREFAVSGKIAPWRSG